MVVALGVGNINFDLVGDLHRVVDVLVNRSHLDDVLVDFCGHFDFELFRVFFRNLD